MFFLFVCEDNSFFFSIALHKNFRKSAGVKSNKTNKTQSPKLFPATSKIRTTKADF